MNFFYFNFKASKFWPWESYNNCKLFKIFVESCRFRNEVPSRSSGAKCKKNTIFMMSKCSNLYKRLPQEVVTPIQRNISSINSCTFSLNKPNKHCIRVKLRRYRYGWIIHTKCAKLIQLGVDKLKIKIKNIWSPHMAGFLFTFLRVDQIYNELKKIK